MSSVLFVCTANRFRSALSEVFFSEMLLVSKQSDKCLVGSAGTWTKEGFPATREATKIATEMNLKISEHRSRIVTGEIINKYQVVIVMEQGHKEALINEFPEVKGRIYMLSEISTYMKYDIPDPYATDELPNEVAKEIKQLLILGFERILHLADKENKKN